MIPPKVDSATEIGITQENIPSSFSPNVWMDQMFLLRLHFEQHTKLRQTGGQAHAAKVFVCIHDFVRAVSLLPGNHNFGQKILIRVVEDSNVTCNNMTLKGQRSSNRRCQIFTEISSKHSLLEMSEGSITAPVAPFLHQSSPSFQYFAFWR